MRSVCFLTVFLTASINIFSQSTEGDRALQLGEKAESFVFSNKDSAYFYFKQAIQLAKQSENDELTLSLYDYLVYTTSYYFDVDENLKQLKLFESELKKAPATLKDFDYYQNSIDLFYGNYYYDLKHYSKSKTYFKNIFKKYNITDSESLTEEELSVYLSSLDYLGLINKNTGQNNKAKITFEKLIRVCEKLEEGNAEVGNFKIKAMMVFADVLINTKEYERAQEMLEFCIAFYENSPIPSRRNSLITSYLNLSELYRDTGQLKSSLAVVKKIKTLEGIKFPFELRASLLEADILNKSGEFLESSVVLEYILEKTISYHKNSNNQDVADIYIKIADQEFLKENHEAALNYYQKALVSISTEFKAKDWSSNPSSKEVFSKIKLITILKKKLTVLKSFERYSGDQKVMVALNKTSKSLVTTLDDLLPEFESKLDKVFLVGELYPAFHEMIDASYNAYQKTNNTENISDAFMLMEKSKNILLRESVRSARANNYGDIPSELVDKEYQLRASITNAEKKIYKQDKKNKINYQDSLFQVSSEYYKLIDSIENAFPKYYKLKYNYQTIPLLKVQKQLLPNETLLQLHCADNNIFAITIKRNTVDLKKIPFTHKLKSNITTYYNLLSKSETEKETLFTSNEIYNELLKPILKNDGNRHLTIIPDGILHYLPFESLVTSITEKQFLLESKYIRYASSTTLLFDESNKLHKKSKLLAVAPSFKASTKFKNLPYAAQEVKTIGAFFDGKTLVGENATLKNFKKEQSSYNILHLATHANVSDEQMDYSYLAFSDKEEEQLYLKDIYNWKISAALVTLSACETGIGQLKNGEGMLSLSRGFQYAGAPSLTTSLWRINDRTTGTLMKFFYKGLSDGLTKSEALQKAKLTYLNTVQEPELKHPYYWAGFIVIGNNAPLTSPFNWYWVLVIGLLLAIVILFKNKLLKFF